MAITNGKINQAGRCLAGKTSTLSDGEANIILKDFRYTHQHPMDLLKKTINRKLIDNHIKALVSQRLKRIPSIVKKLKNTQSTKLATIQDIGGLRIVVNDINEVYLIKDAIREVEKEGEFKFTCNKETDYIAETKESGYRSIHLMYRYNRNVLPEEQQCRVEIQIRTKIQHSWATAVEVLGVCLNQSLKQSLGDKKYLNIFKDISKLFASLEDKTVDYELVKQVKNNIENIRLLDVFQNINIVFEDVGDNSEEQYLLLKMDFKNKKTEVAKYSKADFNQANEDYSKMELDNKDNGVEVVLISIQDIKELEQSYPNYFMDTTKFIENLEILFEFSREMQILQKMIDKSKDKEQKAALKKMLDNIIKQTLGLFSGSKK